MVRRKGADVKAMNSGLTSKNGAQQSSKLELLRSVGCRVFYIRSPSPVGRLDRVISPRRYFELRELHENLETGTVLKGGKVREKTFRINILISME